MKQISMNVVYTRMRAFTSLLRPTKVCGSQQYATTQKGQNETHKVLRFYTRPWSHLLCIHKKLYYVLKPTLTWFKISDLRKFDFCFFLYLTRISIERCCIYFFIFFFFMYRNTCIFFYYSVWDFENKKKFHFIEFHCI